MIEMMEFADTDFNTAILNLINIIKENLDMMSREMEDIQTRPKWNF